MPSRDLLIDPAAYEHSPVLCDQAEIRRRIQHLEMEQLTAIIHKMPSGIFVLAIRT